MACCSDTLEHFVFMQIISPLIDLFCFFCSLGFFNSLSLSNGLEAFPSCSEKGSHWIFTNKEEVVGCGG